MADYVSKYSGQEIDDLLDKVNAPDSAPTAGSQNLVKSGGIKTALDSKAAASDVSSLSSQVTNLGNRTTNIEGKIPSAATPSNKLADKAYVDGEVSDLYDYMNGCPIGATFEQNTGKLFFIYRSNS